MSTNGQTAAGVTVPDTKLAREATELVRSSTSDLVHHHSPQGLLVGSVQGRNRGLSFDPELLYVGAMFHDLGLNEQFRRSGRRFEVDIADEAPRFMQGTACRRTASAGCGPPLPCTPHPGSRSSWNPRSAWSPRGVEYDVLGIGYHDIGEADRAEITALHPRPDFKRNILQAFTEGIAPKPETTFGNVKADVLERFVPGYRRGNFVDIIENSAWPE